MNQLPNDMIMKLVILELCNELKNESVSPHLLNISNGGFNS